MANENNIENQESNLSTSINSLNRGRNYLYLESKDIERIAKYGEIGMYITMIRQNNDIISLNGEDKYPDECTDDEISVVVIHGISFYRRKIESMKIIVSSNDMTDSFITALKYIPISIPVLIQGHYAENYNLIDKIISEYGDNRVYLKLECNNYDLSMLDCIANANTTHKLVKREWSVEQNKDLYVEDDSNIDNIEINIDNTDNLLELRSKFNTLKHFFERYINTSVTINMNITDIRFFKTFQYFISDYECDNNWPYERITYNLNVDQIEDQIGYHDTRSLWSVTSEIHINTHGVYYEDYGEYQYFNNFTKFVLSRLPENATELEKVVYISKFIIDYFNYDDKNYKKLLDGTGETPDRSFYDFASQGVGVCRDYAAITKELLNKAGIRCEYIGSTTYDYERDKDIPGKIKRSDTTGKILDSKYFSHAFNLVYIDNQPYWLDNTWIYRDEKLCESDFLLSTDSFEKTHGEYVEVKKIDCPNDYDRTKILETENKISNYLHNYTNEELRVLSLIHQNTLLGKEVSTNPQER